jgi:flavin-dependent dehydrogenase
VEEEMTAPMATIQATHSIDELAGTLWDAIVIGAGPAGTVAARELARQGAQTLLVERQSFPRGKVCGGCLNGRALAGLAALGLEHVLAEARAVPVRRFMVHTNKRCVELDLPAGVAIDRSAFDAQLVRAAIAAGAAFLSETVATVDDEFIPTSASRTVQLCCRGQQSVPARARAVLVADGLGHNSARHLDVFRGEIKSAARIGIGLVAHDPRDAYAAGAIYMAVARDGYVGLVRTADGNLNVAAALDASSLRSVELPGQAIRRILGEAGLPDLPGVEGPGWRGTLPLTRANRRLAAARIFLLGDAAGYIEPFTGEGMGRAIDSAMSVVPCVIGCGDRWDAPAARAWEADQQRQNARGQLACRVLAHLLRRPAAVDFAVGILRVWPALARPMIRRIHLGPANVQASLS